MDLSRQDYPGMLTHLQPVQAVKVLDDRVRYINRINIDMADWLQERRRIEEGYAHGLRKLAARQFSESEVADLGVFATPWQKIVTSTEALAQAHHSLAQNIFQDVETPMRDFAAGNSEMQAMHNIAGNLRAIAKEADNAHKKQAKLTGKGGKADAGKVASAASEVEAAQGQWDSQAPYVFERLQAVDEARVDHQRSGLTQFQTHVIECFSATGNSAEECLNALLNVQTADEITTFAIKTTRSLPVASSTGTGASTPMANAVGNMMTTTTTQERRKSLRQEPMPPPPTTDAGSSLHPIPATSRQDEGASTKSGSVQEEKKKGGLSGLKRGLGTVIGRRRQSTHPYQQNASPERKKSSNNIGSAFGRFRQSHQQIGEQHLSPPTTGRTFSSDGPESPRASNEPPPNLERIASYTSDRAIGTPLQHNVAETNGNAGLANGAASTSHSALPEPLMSTAPTAASEPPKDEEGFSLPTTSIDPIQQAMNEAAEANAAAQFKVNIKNAPIQEDTGDASAAMADVANALQMTATPQRAATNRGRRNRNTMLVSGNVPIPEIPRDPSPSGPPPSAPASAPLPSAPFPAVAFPSVPAATSPAPVPTPPPVVAETSRSTDTPPPQQVSSPSSPQLPFNIMHRSTLGLDSSVSDTHSIRSGRSLSSLLSVKHPNFNEPGLNSSIVETINAEFSKGLVTRAVMTGELALAYNHADLDAPFGQETILLENFSSLEKVAPNPAFIEPVPDKTGQFTVDLSHVTKTAVAFKYQVHLEEGSFSSHVPLLLTSDYRVEPTQTLAKVQYSLNPSFVEALPESSFPLTLNGVVIILHLDPTGAKAKSCNAKPAESLVFRKAENLIYWKLGDITFTKGEAPQKLVAQFKTDGEAKVGNVEARWEMSGDHLPRMGSGLAVTKLGTDAKEEENPSEDDPFADAEEEIKAPSEGDETKENWTQIHVVKRWRAGPSYLALPAGS